MFHWRKDPAQDFGKVKAVPCDWVDFEIDPILSFSPDAVVMWNGYAPWNVAVTSVIKANFKTYHIEFAWLPQKLKGQGVDHLYIDDMDAGGRGSIAQTCSIDIESYKPQDQSIRYAATLPHLYSRPSVPPMGLKRQGYIFVPLQLNTDTSILSDSHIFKDMNNFLGWVTRKYKNDQIVVKFHPLDAARPDLRRVPEGVIEAPKDIPAHHLLSHSKATIGINSTVLIEGLVHPVPIGTVGHNVACNKGVYSEHIWEDPTSLYEVDVNMPWRKKVLEFLVDQMWSRTDPANWVIEVIEGKKKKIYNRLSLS